MRVSELVEPAYFKHPDYAVTVADEVADLAALANFPPDPEQRLALEPTFGLDKRGRLASFEVAIIGPRQNIKTGFFKIVALGKSFLLGRPLLVWSAHEFATAQESFRDLTELIESTPELDSRVKQIHRGNGDEAIELLNGARIKFKARTKGGGRGLSGQDVFLDEAFALLPAHMGALLPLLSAQDDPQVFYGSSAGLAVSEYLRSVRDRGRLGDPRMTYVEWCDETPCKDAQCSHLYDPRVGSGPDGCALDRVEGWRNANPQAGRRIKIETIASERRAMARIPLEFARERLGWWDEPGELEHIFGATKWAECGTKPIAKPPTEGMALALAVNVDRSSSCIMSAVPLPGRKLVGVVHWQLGTAGLLDEAKRLQDEYGCEVVLDGHGPGADLIEPGRKAGIRLTVVDTKQVLDAFAAFYDAVQTQGIAHMKHPELEDAVQGAQPRRVGDRTAVGRRNSAADVAPLEGAILASWAIGKAKRRRPRSAVV